MGTMAIHVDRCMNLGSIARRDILFRRRLYIVVMYSDGATKHRSPAVVVTDDTAIFDFNVEFSLFPEHRALDIEIFEKRRVSKDSRVATGQINLTRVYGQCCKRKDGEPFELSAPLVLDGAVITRTDTTEMNRSSYQEKTNKPTPPSKYNTWDIKTYMSVHNEWLHNTSLPNEMARMNLSANRNRSLGTIY
ncbi:hypothetical protein SARC_03308 [Sphaeroforma arctica JP610]|uniref:C2 domain-containing protein n=1 Tax=Sphaeroforma arctica JP610 TaxID=667725 RepID=A0A0L0G620_9EUKA|nr:hypothetical protein SARC_03308 [Sphaeroforma arctica JP610]KNC84475.1 hypothetical protein SARC_03308 [Sphaeroforma arctica JP610]|eukprot:XP_014158377.1 hypothetical protein SARC_03308 [Sphaeroforma arctica JP610]